MRRRRFANLDGLRAICIMAVLWHHAPVLGAWEGPTHQLLGRGFLGVDMFFVLSGFLITTLLLRERDRTGRISISGFYARRARRILPPYLLLVTSVAAWWIVVKGQEHYTALLPYYLFFLANFLTEHIPLLGPMWSLAVEEQYYVVWPLLLLIVPARWIVPLLVLLIGLNVAGILGWLAPLGFRAVEWGPLLLALPNSTYAPILLGSLGAILMHNPPGFARMAPVLSRPETAPVALAGVLLVAGWGPADVRGWTNLAIHLLMLVSVLAMALREEGTLSRLLRWNPVARFGQVSYGTYLYHLVALHFADALAVVMGAGPWTVFVLYVALSWLMAEASWRWWEARFLRSSPRPVLS